MRGIERKSSDRVGANAGRVDGGRARADGSSGLADPLRDRLADPLGSPLPTGLRSRMETAFDTDFSKVRIVQGGAAEAMGAEAFTRGDAIHLKPGPIDERILGHELAHVVQQRSGRVPAGGSLNEDAVLESEANALGARAARGERAVAPSAAVGPSRAAPSGPMPAQAWPAITAKQREKRDLRKAEQQSYVLSRIQKDREQAQRAPAYDKAALQANLEAEGGTGYHFGADDWDRKDSLTGALTSDVRGMFGTMFGADGVPQTERERAQRGVLNRSMVAMAYGGLESRNNEGDAKKQNELLEKQKAGSSFSAYKLPMASVLAHGGRAQINFGSVGQGPGDTQDHMNSGWNWLATGDAGRAGARDAQFENGRKLNPTAGLDARGASTHNARVGGDQQLHETGGLLVAPTSKTAGMNLSTAGRGAPLPRRFGRNHDTTVDMRANGGAPTMQEGGVFPVDPAKKTGFYGAAGGAMMKGVMGVAEALAAPVTGVARLAKALGGGRGEGTNWLPGTKNEGGQQGHLLMAGRNLRTKEGMKSNVQLGIETSAPERQSISGELHDAKALSAPDSVFGQEKFRGMVKPTEQGGLGLNPHHAPLGVDSLRANVGSGKEFRHMQRVARAIEGMDDAGQQDLYRQVLVSTPAEAKELFEGKYQELKAARRR